MTKTIPFSLQKSLPLFLVTEHAATTVNHALNRIHILVFYHSGRKIRNLKIMITNVEVAST